MAKKPQKAENVTASDVIDQAAKQAPANETPVAETKKTVPIPTYETKEEVAAALGMYGDSYDKLIADGRINAPTRAELRERGDAGAGAAKKTGKKRKR